MIYSYWSILLVLIFYISSESESVSSFSPILSISPTSVALNIANPGCFQRPQMFALGVSIFQMDALFMISVLFNTVRLEDQVPFHAPNICSRFDNNRQTTTS